MNLLNDYVTLCRVFMATVTTYYAYKSNQNIPQSKAGEVVSHTLAMWWPTNVKAIVNHCQSATIEAFLKTKVSSLQAGVTFNSIHDATYL